MRRRTWFGLLAFAALAVMLAFLTIPIVAVFTNTSPGQLLATLGEDSSREALWLSLRTSFVALVLIVAIGTPAAYLLATRSFRGRAAVLTLIELPLVTPPAVAGIALLAAFASLDPRLLEAARTLGAGPAKTFLTVATPGARTGLASGVALAWGRALGEFGATLMFAGSLQGVTQTAPLAIFARFASPNGFTAALALSAVLIAISAALLLSVKLIGGDRPLEGP